MLVFTRLGRGSLVRDAGSCFRSGLMDGSAIRKTCGLQEKRGFLVSFFRIEELSWRGSWRPISISDERKDGEQ
jgi:hypothetical protein